MKVITYLRALFKLPPTASEKGFTIVELMVALSILSTILVVSSLVMIEVGSLYIKGVNAADLQNVNRNVIADIASALQFSGNEPFPCPPIVNGTPSTCSDPTQDNNNLQVNTFCIDDTRYSYVLNREQGYDPAGASNQTQTNYVLWRDTMASGSQCPPLNLSSTASNPPSDTNTDTSKPGYDMLPDHMRLTKFKVTENPTGVFSIDIGMAYGDSDLLAPDGSYCKGGEGTQYCAVSDITMTVARRIQ